MTPPAPSCDASALAIVRVSDYAAFLALRGAWNELVTDRSLFLRHEWFDAAWQWRSSDPATHMALLCAYSGTRLVGVCPLIGHQERGAGMTLRVFEFLTVPDNQLCDVIAAEPYRTAVANTLAAELAARRKDWDVLRLSYLPEDAIAGTELPRALAKLGLTQQLISAGGNPYVSLQSSWDDYYATRSRRLKKANNLTANRLNKAGEIRIVWLRPDVATREDTMAALDAAIAVSANSWKRNTGNSLNSPGPQAFIRRLSELASQEGWLSLWLLVLNDKPLAMEYQVVFGGNVHALRADIVDRCEEISPGAYLNRHLLEQLFGRGLQRYLMGPGDNPYKKHWTEESEPLSQLQVYSPSARGRLVALWEQKIKPALRTLKAKTTRRNAVEEK